MSATPVRASKSKGATKTTLPSPDVARAPVARIKAKKGSTAPSAVPALNAEERNRLVARAAYFRAEKRGFAPGYELQDWVEAEAEVRRLIGAD